MTAALSIGLPGTTDRDFLRRLAPVIEERGYRALWLNDTPDGDALEGLAVAASVTSTLGLGVGVIPLNRQPAETIVARVRELDLPLDRLRLGVGPGPREGSIARLSAGLAALHESLPVPVLVGALGPRMREVSAWESEGIVFNWLPADVASTEAHELRSASNGRAKAVLYLRVITDPAARGELAIEAGKYLGMPAYAANFARLGIDPMDATLDFAADGATGLPRYADAVDEIVFRLITVAGAEADLRASIETLSAFA